MRFTYDERIEDGLNANDGIQYIKRVLEHPYELLGCLKEDGSDEKTFGQIIKMY